MEFLPHKTRQSILEIDLSSILHNFNYFKSIVQDSTKFVMVIKAFAYGAGIKNIARLFENEKVEYLAVACIDEGVELKDAGIEQKIIIFNPELEGLQKLIEYGLEPVIYDFESLNNIIEALSVFRSYYKPYPIHIKLDSGMHRLGFNEKQMPKLHKILIDAESIKVKSVLSHLVASGNPEFDEFTKGQIAAFGSMAERMMSVLGYRVNRHILNSGGIERFPEAQFEMVRLGIGLYGMSSNHAHLRNVYTWKTQIAQLKKVPRGESVSYNRSWVAKRDSVIATLFIGYADGLNRGLGNENWSLKWKGKRVLIVGDICMDLCMVDVTDVDAKIGDELIIFDHQDEVYKMAELLNTIHYEVLTNISKRVKRVYIK
ncbi:MAG: alanine racemase [Crocinitomicaceae bacterium]|nr:alanine racemase [Crocinitomicaceae bacterium]|tara:strand:- start:8098 stop:9213 length:1116 start_codon:yes stop_codon:yes gene_type:complete